MALIAAAVPPLPAQESATGTDRTASEAAAVLVSGPVRGQNLPFLPPNTIEYQRGVYELGGAPAARTPASAAPGSTPPASASPGPETTVEVFYTEAPVFRRGTWTETSCGERTVHLLPDAGGTLVHYAWPQAQRHAFFLFGAAAEGSKTPPAGAGAAGNEGATDDAAAIEATGAAAVARSECDFIDAFLERFSFFLDTTDVSGAAPFPAVLPR